MKLLALAALVSLLGPEAARTSEIVVLSTGEHLDVESYEIQEQVVVIRTWDGRLRTLPRTYVDVEATEEANDHATPEQEIAPERLEKARQACDDYGVHHTVSIYREVLDSELQKLRGHMSIQRYDLLRAAFRNAFDRERAFDRVVASFAENANLDLLNAWSGWLETPLAQRMVAMENAELDEQDAVAARRYYIDLRADPEAYSRRLEIVNRLDEARKSTLSGIEVVLHLVEAFYEAGKTIFPDEDVEYDAEQLRSQLAPSVKDANLRGFLVLFREAGDDDLEQYIAYWNTRDGQRVVNLMNAALETGAREGSEVAMQMVAGKRHTVP